MMKLVEAIRLTREVVAEYGEDFRYCPEGSGGICHYVPMPQGSLYPESMIRTGCLVGTVMERSGVPRHEVARWRGPIATVAASHPGLLDAATLKFFKTLQRHQDAGHTWGEALATAVATVRRGE